MNDAEICRKKGWVPGTRLVGDETVIQITAIGERYVLCKLISHEGETVEHQIESTWTLSCRNWKKIPA
jgi:hypothetical protein